MEGTQADLSAAAATRSARAALKKAFKARFKSKTTEDTAENAADNAADNTAVSPAHTPTDNGTEAHTDDPNELPSEDTWSESLLGDARKLSKYKKRSLDTSRDDHLLKIASASQRISVVFLGDSMVERMTTTGKTGNLYLWPSETMFPEKDLEDINLGRKASNIPELVRISGLLNAGCGGDKIENILYRFFGDPEHDLPGLAEALLTGKRRCKIKLWVLQAGTNNLHPKKGLTDASVQAYRALIESILHTSDVSTHVLLTGLFYRKDIKNELVDQANDKLKKLVDELTREWLPDSPGLGLESNEATQTVKVKGKETAAKAEERNDSVIGVSISPTGTHESAEIKEKADAIVNAEEVLPYRKGNPPLSTGQDPTMPQFKPSRCHDIFDKDPEAVGIPRESLASTEKNNSGMAPTASLSTHRETSQNYSGIQFLPAPRANDPETWLEDHVHLHEGGYRLWTRTLFPKVKEMLTLAERASP